MGRKLRYTKEQKVDACKKYLSGEKSAKQIARELCMGKRGEVRIREWANRYKASGAEVFEYKPKNNPYTKEFKEKIVREYLNGKGTLRSLSNKYNIPSSTTIITWIKKYNNHMEQKDYNPHSEVYMNDTLKVSKKEKIEIVKWCLEHNRNIIMTAAHFNGNYAQIYSWVKKYEKNGEDGLTDKRGKHKQEEELTELEKANRRIQQLEREKEEYRKMYELLKKAEKVERW